MITQLSIPENALTVKEAQPFTALCFTTSATLQTLAHQAEHVEKLYQEAERLALQITGPIQWIYTGVNGDETNVFQLEIALPIDQVEVSSGNFTYKAFPPLQCVTYTYTGSWSDFGELYDGLFKQLYQAGKKNDGRVREIYIEVNVDNPSACVTEIQIALA